MCKTTISLKEFSHIPRQVGPKVQQRINALKVGQKMQDLPEELWHESFRYYVKEDPTRSGGPNLRLIRLDPRRPSLTVTGYIFNKFVHPIEDRYITPREAARLQGFPDDFIFHGTLTSVQRQVGNAVPVQLATAVIEAVLAHLYQHKPFGLGSQLYTAGCFPALSLFSGAGGLDIGVLNARHKKTVFDVKACVELDHDCCETLRRNFGARVSVVEEDIAKLHAKRALDLCQTENELLPLIFGGPPCQAFSQAGKQNGIHDDRGKLIFDFLRIVKEVKPAYFVMENVSNLRGVAGGNLLREIQERIDAVGYNFTCNLLCAADYGAAQLRRRLFFIGVRKPYPAVQAPIPTHVDDGESLFAKKRYVGVEEAFEGLPSLVDLDLEAEISVQTVVR
jgi:DNA (cytosine-5)-methyltransferase 1